MGEEKFIDNVIHLQNVDDTTFIASLENGKELSLRVSGIEGIYGPEIVRAKWILKDEKGNGVCSHCHRQDKIDSLALHCRYCGAKMDKE